MFHATEKSQRRSLKRTSASLLEKQVLRTSNLGQCQPPAQKSSLVSQIENSDDVFPSPTTQTPCEQQFSVHSGASKTPESFQGVGNPFWFCASALSLLRGTVALSRYMRTARHTRGMRSPVSLFSPQLNRQPPPVGSSSLKSTCSQQVATVP